MRYKLIMEYLIMFIIGASTPIAIHFQQYGGNFKILFPARVTKIENIIKNNQVKYYIFISFFMGFNTVNIFIIEFYRYISIIISSIVMIFHILILARSYFIFLKRG